MIEEAKPYLVIGSPPCTSFCACNERLDYKIICTEVVWREKEESQVLLDFADAIYDVQLAAKKQFLHEPPASGACW